MLSSEVVLSGRYRLDERVATGGMGDVWRASDLILGRQVAVKVLLPALVSDPDFIARFRAEARIMAALRHPGIVQVFDCGADDLPEGGRADYLVMEFVDGEPLSKRIETAGRLDVAETMSIVAQAAAALNAAHRGGIVHRDVKPSNLLVHEDGTVVLVDFGVARSTDITSITSTNAVPGTALYMAPEQAAGRPVSGATDIYALGAVTYCCLTGSPPFTGDNPLQVAVRHLDDEPPELPNEIPEAVRALVSRALAKDPLDRFTTGAAMAEAARTAVTGGEPPTAMATAVPLRDAGPGAGTDVLAGAAVASGTRGQRRRGPLVGAGVAMLVALVGLGAALGAMRNIGDVPAVELPTTSPTTTPAGPLDLPAANEQVTSTETSRPDRPPAPGVSPSASVPTRASTTPSQTSSPPTPTTTPTVTAAPTTSPSDEPTTTPPAPPTSNPPESPPPPGPEGPQAG
ncbi:serine/threonine-protein kinase [Micromonospora luteifusca]|uniref:non-specific serine/threonine protein kinase n=1 Tax=Micromonospora luteifusca TaxID=709860 RepID=A0ABS2M4H9_9ACTN|nr:serine/threonine-protein kinase [Micromonospora luteifusca]MBM7495248.1 serine/threonine-protein kinase [Micromonospora luteifusca]